MSIIFGLRKNEGGSVVEPELRRLALATQSFAPDGTFVTASGLVGMGFQPYHTQPRSTLESSPLTDAAGNVVAFDGRLDNHKELSELLEIRSQCPSDSEIVLAAFRRWGEKCCSHLVGDWALALWSSEERSLYLARDHAGTRTLFYEISSAGILWSTYLETFLADRPSRDLDEGFIARYLICEPLRDFTPYNNVRAVTPGHYVVIRTDSATRITPHWQWMTKSKIIYKTDEEYEQHFLSLFREAVRRRSEPAGPFLAQLSGGMDSTSIVCMADQIRLKQGACSEDLIDTISYYDDSEPNWNEKPYFTLVEEARDKRGVHIAASALDRSFEPPPPNYPLPGADSRTALAEKELEERLGNGKYRVVLSGIGGDELLGGPPDPLPELADYLVSLRLECLLRHSFAWCIESRTPLMHMLAKAAKLTVRSYPRLPVAEKKIPPWISENLRIRFGALGEKEKRPLTLGLLPSAIDKGMTWWNLLETLPHRFHALTARYEFRYPYLDRDLVDFLLRIPPNLLLRPGRRRFMMRRALRNIVPVNVLERRRKAYVSHGPLKLIPQNRRAIAQLFAEPLSANSGWILPQQFSVALDTLDTGSLSEWLAPVIRAINLELWLRSGRTQARA
jgi:asparagine synthase (glutamine-hydrolysing)